MNDLKQRVQPILVPLGLAVNIISSISIIQLNKFIYTEFGFPNITLTCIHFVLTYLGLLLCIHHGVFKRVEIPLAKMVPMAFTFCGFVVLTNISLQLNAIGWLLVAGAREHAS